MGKKKKKPVSFCIGYAEGEMEKILSSLIGEHSYENVHASHTTLAYKPNKEQIEQFIPLLGKPIIVNLIGVFYDEHCYTMIVEPMIENVYYGSSLPHITLSTSGETKPAYSNELINRKDKKRLKVYIPLFIKGYIAALIYTREGKAFVTNTELLKV